MATNFAIYLFSTPIKHKRPSREDNMEENTKQSLIHIPAIGKKIQVYQLGSSSKKILLVHGWSGRGTQLFKIAEMFVELGFETISFDAPGHGKSPKSRTNMREYIHCIEFLEQQHGPFQCAVGHSLGGMSILNSAARFLQVEKLICVGTAD
ncbi:MAG: alpha/beta hydrolase, partial [Flavobacteriaceae bacterium]|nr:alpha/beta hydrolase [Flavobacteriaceae bacterium]